MSNSQDRETERREDEVLKRMLETPPRPHDADKKGGKDKDKPNRKGNASD